MIPVPRPARPRQALTRLGPLRPLVLALCAGLAMVGPLPLHAGADDLDQALAEHWRATSRFGYSPFPAPAPADPSAPRGRSWALQQLELARTAAGQPARIPEALAGVDTPLPTLFARFREEREARRRVREPAAEALLGTAANEDGSLNFSRDMARQAATWRLEACSRPDLENPLLARLTEFWFNHLNVSAGKGAVRPFVGHYVLHAIRPHVLGRYEDLLLASARHPAMLFYLDQAQSVAEGSPGGPMAAGGARRRGLNENYARELLELHTLGVNGGYTQADVRELARVLTGWTVDPQSPTGFRFAARLHDAGPKTLLGQHLAGGGMDEGEAAIRLLARQPATAQRIALRLAQFFVADQPPPALVQRLAQRYLATQGDLQAVLRTLIESPETWDTGTRLFKTPLDHACATLAAAGGPQGERETRLALGFLAGAGQPLHGWQTPDGYPTDAATWLSPEALSRRADFAMAVGRRLPDARALQPWLTPTTRARITQEPPRLQAGLALASPEFMNK